MNIVNVKGNDLWAVYEACGEFAAVQIECIGMDKEGEIYTVVCKDGRLQVVGRDFQVIDIVKGYDAAVKKWLDANTCLIITLEKEITSQQKKVLIDALGRCAKGACQVYVRYVGSRALKMVEGCSVINNALLGDDLKGFPGVSHAEFLNKREYHNK